MKKKDRDLGAMSWALFWEMWEQSQADSSASCTKRQSWTREHRKMGRNKAREDKREKSILHFV